jgi:outer membrane lipoprotein-sorting protein
MKNYIIPKMCNLLKNFMRKSYALNLCIAFFCIFATESAFAETKFLNQYSQELTQIENFLNNIKTLTCRFIQNSNGSIVEGKFYLSRNKESSGKMRVEYLADPKVLIVVNGAILSYQDIELDEVSRLSTNTTPASFLTRPNISFSAKDVEITNVIKNNNEIKVSVMKKNRKEAGEFSLIFKLDPFEFVKMEVKNDLEQIIAIQLKNIDFQSKISDKLFTIKNNDNE